MKGMIMIMYNTQATTAADIETLKELMHDEAFDAKYYADLACRRHASCAAALFNRISREETRHLCRLQAEYFILTGMHYSPCVANINIPCNYLEALRERFQMESEGASAYLDAAAATSDPRLAELYKEFSSDEQCHAEEMACLIKKCMCNY